MLNSIKKVVLPHRRKDKFHYGAYLGSFKFFRLLSWNIFHPYRLLNRIRWSQLFSLSYLKKKRFKKTIYKNFNQSIDLNYKNDELIKKFNEYIDNGGVIIENYFSNEKINKFVEIYSDAINQIKNLNEEEKNLHVVYKTKYLFLSRELMDFWLDDRLLEFIKHSLKSSIYGRTYPVMYYTKNNGYKISSSRSIYNKSLESNKVEFKKLLSNLKIDAPIGWHVDHTPGHTNLQILLQDIGKDDSHMEFLPGSHKYLNMSDAYSDETIMDFKRKPMSCIGAKGTIYLHNGNTLHRLNSSSKKDRLSLLFSFTPGGRVSFKISALKDGLSNEYDLDSVSPKKREILKGLFPLSVEKDIIGNKIINARFRGK